MIGDDDDEVSMPPDINTCMELGAGGMRAQPVGISEMFVGSPCMSLDRLVCLGRATSD